MSENKKVAVIMGSASDREVMQAASDAATSLGCETIVKVMSAHRNPNAVTEFAKSAQDDGFCAIIAGAGKAAHLPGVIASYSNLPVIGVPIKTSDLGGLDSLLSIVQMPKGVPVATVAINGAENAGILAAQIVALGNRQVADALKAFKDSLAAVPEPETK